VYVQRNLVALLAVSLLAIPSLGFAQQTSKSAALAAELTRLLDENKLDSVAAKAADQYVGALYIAGHAAAGRAGEVHRARADESAVESKGVSRRLHRFEQRVGSQDQDFHFRSGRKRSAVQEGKQPAVRLGRPSGKTIAFDGEWDKAKISEADYTKTYQSTDEQYVQMLQALIGALKKPS
jgi:hypothetical protein